MFPMGVGVNGVAREPKRGPFNEPCQQVRLRLIPWS